MSRPKRTPRQAKIPPQVHALFLVGCGHNHLPDGEFERLWAEHGELFARMVPDWHETSWASLMQMPDPEGGRAMT